jgi:GNAT superfamily N-acetyltransferase
MRGDEAFFFQTGVGSGTGIRRCSMPTQPAAGIVPATPADLAYVVSLQKKNGEALGFIPRVALAEKIELGRIWLAQENGEPAGFLHHGSLAVPEVRIFQAAIQYDAQRRKHGMSLVTGLLDRAKDAGASAVSLRCLDFLDANDFWTAAGFSLIGREKGARGTLNVWGARLYNKSNSPAPFEFHSRVHPCPRCGKPTMDTWTRGAIRRRMCTQCITDAE